jgi:hypothetical protein
MYDISFGAVLDVEHADAGMVRCREDDLLALVEPYSVL